MRRRSKAYISKIFIARFMTWQMLFRTDLLYYSTTSLLGLQPAQFAARHGDLRYRYAFFDRPCLSAASRIFLMLAFIVRRAVADAAHHGGGGAAGFCPVQLGRRRSRVSVGRQDGLRRADRQHPRASWASTSRCGCNWDLRPANRHLRLRQRLEHGRAGGADHRQPAGAVADGADSADHPGNGDRRGAGAGHRLRARLAVSTAP